MFFSKVLSSISTQNHTREHKLLFKKMDHESKMTTAECGEPRYSDSESCD